MSRDRRRGRFVRVGYITRLDRFAKRCPLRRRGAMAAHHLPTIIWWQVGVAGSTPVDGTL